MQHGEAELWVGLYWGKQRTSILSKGEEERKSHTEYGCISEVFHALSISHCLNELSVSGAVTACKQDINLVLVYTSECVLLGEGCTKASGG